MTNEKPTAARFTLAVMLIAFLIIADFRDRQCRAPESARC